MTVLRLSIYWIFYWVFTKIQKLRETGEKEKEIKKGEEKKGKKGRRKGNGEEKRGKLILFPCLT